MIVFDRYKNQTVGLIGLGKSGNAMLSSLLLGKAKVIVMDDNTEKLAGLRCDDNIILKEVVKEKDLINLSALFVSPGIPAQPSMKHKIVVMAEQLQIPIMSDIDMLYCSCPDAFYIGITGTNGKSTVTTMIYHILQQCFNKPDNTDNIQIGGNIGKPVLTLNPFESKNQIYVLELSSFQLDLISSTVLDISLCLNITQDHLDRYGNMANYAKSKEKIFYSPATKAIISLDYPETREIYNKLNNKVIIPISTKQVLSHGISITDNMLHIRNCLNTQKLDIIMSPYLLKHNPENIAASIATAMLCECSIDRILKSIKYFQNLPHRMELVLKSENVICVNDSKATNVASTNCALSQHNNIYWILGGISKDDGIESLSHLFYKVKCAYLIGQATEKFAKVLDIYGVKYKICYTLENALTQAYKDIKEANGIISKVPNYSKMQEAVELSSRPLSKPATDSKMLGDLGVQNSSINEDLSTKSTQQFAAEVELRERSNEITLLLSPACSSLDQWSNFEERGNYFKKRVKELFSISF